MIAVLGALLHTAFVFVMVFGITYIVAWVIRQVRSEWKEMGRAGHNKP